MNEQFFVYILASRKHVTLYIGVANDLIRRVHQHKTKVMRGFAKRYNVHELVYFETFDDPPSAISREKQLKKIESRMEASTDRTYEPDRVDLSQSLI